MKRINLNELLKLLTRSTEGQLLQVNYSSLYVDSFHYDNDIGFVIRVFSYKTMIMEVTRYGIIESGYMKHSSTTDKHCRLISRLFWDKCDIATFPIAFYGNMCRSCGFSPILHNIMYINRLLELTGQRYFIANKIAYGRVYDIKWSKASH